VGERYEKARSLGTNPADYVVDESKRIIIGNPLSQTANGRSYKAQHTKTQLISFVKEVTCNGPEDTNAFFKQLEILASLIHPAFVRLIGFVIPAGEVRGKIITEFMPHGSLAALIDDRPRYATMSPTAKVKIAVGIVLGMRYLHRCRCSHHDLKSSNILLDENDEIRIRNTARHYIAPGPEVGGQMVDVYSFGTVLWEIMVGERIKEGYDDVLTYAMERNLPPFANGLNFFTTAVLDLCWETEPVDREGFDYLADLLKENSYHLLEGVDVGEIETYISCIENYERKHPPDLISHDGDDDI
jgi:hypothetical protein